jgi:two-component system response regulator MprA
MQRDSDLPLILVVEEDTRTARRLASLLREDGYAVEVARDGALAVGRLSRSPGPDVLITELQLRHVDGFAVARYARAERPLINVIFLTGYPHLVQSRPDAPPSGSIVFTKPLDYDALRAELERRCTLPS